MNLNAGFLGWIINKRHVSIHHFFNKLLFYF
jgi:hypothetical protein